MRRSSRVSGRCGVGGLDADPFARLALAEQPLARLVGDGGDNLGAAVAVAAISTATATTT